VRNGNGISLTDAGKVFLEGSRKILVQVDQTTRASREAGGAEESYLRVGFPEYANHTPVAHILQNFQRLYPYIELKEEELFTLQQTLQQVDALRDGDLDVGFMLAPVEDEALNSEVVLDIELVAAMPMDHPLADRDEVHMSELSGERIILFSRRFHPKCYDYVVECCREAGFVPNLVQRNEPQLYSGATTYRMVASGVGVGIVAKPLVAVFQPGVVFKRLTEPSPILKLAAAWRRDDDSAHLRAFLEVMRG
jgi:DNA-binding transcriptional LysR family regulator